MSPPPSRPVRVLVLTGGLIHLVHQLAAVRERPEVRQGGARVAVLVTGVLVRDPPALAALQEAMASWFARLGQEDPQGFAHLHCVREETALPPGPWDLACVNSQWLGGQREVVGRLGIRRLLVAGDGLGLYYRCARELRALVPSLLGLPIHDPGVSVHYVLSGRQPLWHRPPIPPEPAPEALRRRLFESLVASQTEAAREPVARCRASGPAERPIWLCSVPNLAHQFPGGSLPLAVLHAWRRRLERRRGFDPRRDRLMLLDHPKAPPSGSFGPEATRVPWLAGPLRSVVPLEVLVRRLEQEDPGRPVVVAGLTSALYGVRSLTRARVEWLDLAPLWRANPGYRRRPLEFLHRWLRVRRMALLTAQLEGTGLGKPQ